MSRLSYRCNMTNHLGKPLLLSLALHAGLIGCAVSFTSFFAHVPKPVIIDFSIMDSGTLATQPEQAKQNSRREIQNPSVRAPRKTVSEKPEPDKVLTTAPAPPVTLTEGGGHVTASVATPQAPGAPQQQTANGGGPLAREQGLAAPAAKTAPVAEPTADKYLKQNFEYIKDRIQKNLIYPARAQRMGLTGKVVVSFVILENGHVTNEKILVSSGHSLLDNNVIETIRMVEPFPKPPARAELRIPVSYGIH